MCYNIKYNALLSDINIIKQKMSDSLKGFDEDSIDSQLEIAANYNTKTIYLGGFNSDNYNDMQSQNSFIDVADMSNEPLQFNALSPRSNGEPWIQK